MIYPDWILICWPLFHLEDKNKTGCYYTLTKDYEIKELRTYLSLQLFLDGEEGLCLSGFEACLLVPQIPYCLSRSRVGVNRIQFILL